MPSTQVKLYMLDETAPLIPRDILNDVDLTDDSPFEALKVVENTGNIIDVEATWVEEKVLRNVVSRGTPHDISIKVLRHGWMHIDYGLKIVLASSLGRLSHRVIIDLWKTRFPPVVLLATFDLKRALSSDYFQQSCTLEDIRVSDLPVEDIPALSAAISSCTKKALMNLIKGTPAIVERFTIQFREDIKASFFRNGCLRILANDCEWQELANTTVEIAQKLNLVGGN